VLIAVNLKLIHTFKNQLDCMKEAQGDCDVPNQSSRRNIKGVNS